MGRERQKAKNRSSVPRATQKPRSKKLLQHRANPIIAAHWNSRDTPSQNFARLGLTTKLGHRSGGVVKLQEKLSGQPGSADQTRAINHPTGYGEAIIVRDPETGEVSMVQSSTPDEIQDDRTQLDQHNLDTNNRESKSAHEVVRQLEESAAVTRVRAKVPQSDVEREWLDRLTRKYGEDLEDDTMIKRMQQDKKMNVWQYSEGDIRRRLKRWKYWKTQAGLGEEPEDVDAGE